MSKQQRTDLPIPPNDWDEFVLDDKFYIRSGSTPLRTNAERYFHNGTIPWVKTLDLNESWIWITDEMITAQALRECSCDLLPEKTVLIAMYGGWIQIGRTSILAISTATNQAICSLVPKDNSINPEFLLRFLQQYRFRWKSLACSTRKDPNITRADVVNFRISAPSLLEQKRIIEIIATIDNLIEKTEALIAKYQTVKQGMMHDLFTRGVDAAGKLRPTFEDAPELYKESDLYDRGNPTKIPKDWDVVILSEVVPAAEYGISVACDDNTENIPVLRMMNLKSGNFDLSDLKYSDSLEANQIQLKENDVLFNRTNSLEHVGRTSIWQGELPKASFASYLVRLVPDQQKITPLFLTLWFNQKIIQQVIRRYATPGVQQVNINPTNLRKTLIALPKSIEEQMRITELILQTDSLIGCEKNNLQKLKTKKTGLMQDLLTGKVRVTIDPTEEPLAHV